MVSALVDLLWCFVRDDERDGRQRGWTAAHGQLLESFYLLCPDLESQANEVGGGGGSLKCKTKEEEYTTAWVVPFAHTRRRASYYCIISNRKLQRFLCLFETPTLCPGSCEHRPRPTRIRRIGDALGSLSPKGEGAVETQENTEMNLGLL